MSEIIDLKDFLDNKPNKELKNVVWYNFFRDANIVIDNPKWDWVKDNQVILRDELGLFFWERGGKQHVIFWKNAKNCKFNFDVLKSRAKYDYECDLGRPKYSWWSQDFLDCVACLGEERVKELIKELEKEGVKK